ncbi:MAG: glycosyltransferase [Xenococcus sp. (in: cyanobacteria)]
MKIAFIVGTFPALSVSFIINQIKGLIDQGHEVDIYALDGAPEDISKVHPIVEEYNLLERTYYPPNRPKNVTIRRIKTIGLLLSNLPKNPWVLLPLLNRKRFGKEARQQILFYRSIRFLRRKSYDIIHCQFGIFGIMSLAFRQIGLIEGKLITGFRGYDISKYIQKRGERVYDELFQKGDFFIANCEFFRQRAIKLGCDPEKIVVLGSGIDCSNFAFTPRHFPADGKVKIVTTGRLVEKKGIEYGIRAIASLAETYPNIEYNIIGDGKLREHFEQLITELNVGHLVNLLGWKQQEELIEILDNSHILIAPSVTAADGNQDAPVNTLKEAMAMGLPVIGTLHGGIPELIEDGISGFLVPERDGNAIADKVRHLIEHPEIWSDIGASGRKRVETKYNMEQLNDELVAIYQQVLNQELSQKQLTNQSLAFSNYSIGRS